MELLHQFVIGDTLVACGFHAPGHVYPAEDLSPQESNHLAGLSDRKKTEWLASRELLYRISGKQTRPVCLYDEFGKPHLAGSNLSISVSHSMNWCAAMIGPRPCGTDIQVYSETVRRIAPRFLTTAEQASTSHGLDPLRHLHLLWGAKECMYKAYGRRRLRFRENIHVAKLNATRGTGIGEIRLEGLHLRYELAFRFLPEAMWVACILADDTVDRPGGVQGKSEP